MRMSFKELLDMLARVLTLWLQVICILAILFVVGFLLRSCS